MFKKSLLALNADLNVDTFESCRSGRSCLFSNPFSANQNIIEGLVEQLDGKILVDCTNPVGRGFTHGLNNEQSGSEWIQSLVPNSHVVKAFSIYGYENLQNNQYPEYNLKPAMLFCGNNDAAKSTVGQLIEDLDWEPMDVGGLEQAFHLEHMTLMWVRLVRKSRQSPLGMGCFSEVCSMKTILCTEEPLESV